MYIGPRNQEIKDVVIGSSFPGIPIILFGNNLNLSWGFTTDNRDTSDLIEEYVTPDFKYFIDSEGNISKTFSRKEKIKIKGGGKEAQKIYHTENGILLHKYLKETSVFGVFYRHQKSLNLNSTEYDKNESIVLNGKTFIKALSLRFPSFDLPFEGLNFYSDLMKAKKKEDFLGSLQTFHNPVLAFSWATIDNEIGYTSIGKIPLKNYKESKIIFKDGKVNRQDSEYQRYIPREETPMLINPEKGYIVTANNEAFAWNYENYAQSYAFFNRFHRINQLLEHKFQNENFKFTVEDSIEMLEDVHDSFVEIILPKLIKIFDRNFLIVEKALAEIEKYFENKNENNNNSTFNNNNNINNNLLNEEISEMIKSQEIKSEDLIDIYSNLNKIISLIKKLKTFDFKFTKDSEAAGIYAVYEFLLGKNILLKGERENYYNLYNQTNNFLNLTSEEISQIKSIGFEDEKEAEGILNMVNYWNFVVNLVTEISNKEKINLENCNYYTYLTEFNKIPLTKIVNKILKENSYCENYIINSLIFMEKYSQEKSYWKNDEFKKWGELHYHNYPHEPFEKVDFLRMIFSRKISTGGTRNTVRVSKNKFSDEKSPFVSTHSANLKFICDLNDITRPYFLIDVGNSGNILSKFYDNFVEKNEMNDFVKIKDHYFNDDYELLISFPEENTIILKNPN